MSFANFNKYSATYDLYSNIQKKVANKLISYMNYDVESILEVGCGTGYLSSLLHKKFPASSLFCIDKEPNMVNACKVKNPSAKTFVMDIANNSLHQKFDLIISNFVFQWLENPIAIINDLYFNYLNTKGKLVLSFPIQGTFQHLKNSCQEIGINFPSLSFISLEELKFSFQAKMFSEKIYTNKYTSTLEFLKEIKLIGASSKNSLSISKLRRLISHHDKKNLQFVYNVAFIIVE